MATIQPNIGFEDQSNSSILTEIRASKFKTINEKIDLKAAGVADYNNFGVFLTPTFERELLNLTRKRGVLGQLLDQRKRPAVGHPHRYVDQRGLPNGQGFTDPRTISVTSASNGGTLRNEHYANVRALSGQINFGLFDQQTANTQSSLFPQLVSQDLQDMIIGLDQVADKALWNGTAANLTDSGSIQYCGVSTQITNTIQVNPGASIIDSIRTKVASMMSNQNVVVKPTHIFLNPMLLDLIEQEIKNAATTMRNVPAGKAEVVPGIEVTTINTVAGALPLIPAWEMATRASSVSGATTDYPVAILSMDLIENAYIGSSSTQLFKMGLVSDLMDKYVAVRFDTGAIVKAADVAHAYGYVSR